ncbi:MAG: cysteine--tRNA ligase [Roseovarius sp.]|nr:cysteine--tRNA ligase [Roseovarius sp.]
MTEIKLYNTRTRKKEPFEPLDKGDVRMYVCGPTVYDRAHLGNARPVIVFDVLYRLLRHVYGSDHVTYVRNFTDVDDKINARAVENVGKEGDVNAEIARITEMTTQWFLDDMGALGALEPTQMPRATQYIGQMIDMIETLIEKGHAYEAEGHVLFDVESWHEGYGKLSGRSVDDMIAGARVEVAPYKRNPMDFVLWKPSTPDLPGWDSPWGRGRPGWHIECSAMSYELLGESFDIHGGGNDLMFPHHENEIAQSCCAHPEGEFARYWLHNEMLQVEGRKMSKSLGNFFTVRDLLDQGIPGEVIRFVFLSTHYRKPMDWTAEKAKEAEKTLRRWRGLFAGVEPAKPFEEVTDFLADDLNTAGALNFLAHAGQALFQKAGSKWTVPEANAVAMTWFEDASRFVGSANLLGLLEPDLGDWAALPEADLSGLETRFFKARQTAMQNKDFSEVDRLKAALVDAGVEVRMSKEGVELIPGAGFDPAKLEALK